MAIVSSCREKNTQSLLIDKNLSQFDKLNGAAPYVYEDGIITGTSVMNTPNSFLATKKKYADFILEFDVLVDEGLNSGVQIRSNSLPDHQDGRVHGYQVEIDTSPRKWSGGIYDEARRAWLYPLSLNIEGQKAFKNGAWNRYRIEAIGHRIRTWINGIPCAYLIDDKTSEGFIAFQVHGIYKEENAGKKVQWKNITLHTEQLEKHISPASTAPEESYLEMKLSQTESEDGWKLVTGAEIDLGKSQNIELKVDFNISKEANGSIKYGEGLQFSLQSNTNQNVKTGSIDEAILATNLSEKDNNDIRYKGDGNWNRAHIIKEGNHIEHWLNGIKVVDYKTTISSTDKVLLEVIDGAIDFKNVKWRAW